MTFQDVIPDQKLRDSIVLRLMAEGGSIRVKQRGEKVWIVGKIGKQRIMIHKEK